VWDPLQPLEEIEELPDNCVNAPRVPPEDFSSGTCSFGLLNGKENLRGQTSKFDRGYPPKPIFYAYTLSPLKD